MEIFPRHLGSKKGNIYTRITCSRSGTRFFLSFPDHPSQKDFGKEVIVTQRTAIVATLAINALLERLEREAEQIQMQMFEGIKIPNIGQSNLQEINRLQYMVAQNCPSSLFRAIGS